MTKTTDKPLSREACVTYLQTHGIYSGHSRDSIDQLRELVNRHRNTEPTNIGVHDDTDAVKAEQAKADHDRVKDVPTDDPDAQPEADPIKRLAAAKAEHAKLKAWIASGEKPPRPATPNLDALNEAYAANGGQARRGKRTTAKTQTEAPAPKPGAGWTVLAMRNDKHTDLVSGVIGRGSDAESYTEGRYLVVRNGEAQHVYDMLVAATDGASQFQSRQLVLAQLLIRQAFPKVTDARLGLLQRLVYTLNTNSVDWTVTWAPDATPVFTIDGTEYTTTRAAAEAVGVPTKAQAA